MSIPITVTLWTVHWLMFELTYTHWWELVKSVGCYGRWSVYAMYVAAEAPRTCVWLSLSFKNQGACFLLLFPQLGFFFFMLADWFGFCYDISITGNLILRWSLNSFAVDSTHRVFEKFSVLMKIFAITCFKPWTFRDVVVELDRLCFKVELCDLSKSLHLTFVCDTLF